MDDIVLRVAAKGVLVNAVGKVLILREANTYEEGTNVGKWGIPGGRIQLGESYDDGLRREVKEETGLDVEIGKPLYVGEWRPIIKGVQHQIIAVFTLCRADGDIQLSEEHDAYKWVGLHDVDGLRIMPPDDLVVKRALSHD